MDHQAEPVSPLANLPTDILVAIFPYLDAKSFLALCSTCKGLHEGYANDATYWRHATRSKFRVPNQPVVENDGARWQKLFRRMTTQARVFTWGEPSKNRLGHSRRERACPFPIQLDGADKLGVIADMQCGGWSTTFLTSKGTLHTVGVLNGMLIGYHEAQASGPRQLTFPVPADEDKGI
jgi:SCF-associated factor 1